MDRTAAQLPHQPGIDRAKKKISGFCCSSGTFYVVQYPLNLGCAEISIRDQSGPLPDLFLHVGWNGIDDRCSPAALPDNGIVDRFSCLFIPDDCRFSLIGNADARNVFCFCSDLCHRLDRYRSLRRPDFHRIMLHPARLRVDLWKFPLTDTFDLAFFIKQDTAGTGRPLIKSHDIFHRDVPPNTVLIIIAYFPGTKYEMYIKRRPFPVSRF